MTTATMVQQASALLSSLSTDAGSLLAQLSSTFPLDWQSGATGGHSLLGLKNLTMVSYLHHLILLCSLQLSGSSEDAEFLSERRGDIVDNLIRQRLVLEKMRPMEARIKGHIEGLLRAATSSSANAQERQDNDDEGEGAADVGKWMV